MTQRILYILRHAEAVPPEQGVADRDRPLTETGKAFAEKQGRRLLESGTLPESVLLSPAKRTQETFERVSHFFPEALPVSREEKIYNASLETLFSLLVEQPPEIKRLLLVGHNPGLSYLAQHFKPRLIEGLSPGMCYGFRFDMPGWETIETAKAEHFF